MAERPGKLDSHKRTKSALNLLRTRSRGQQGVAESEASSRNASTLELPAPPAPEHTSTSPSTPITMASVPTHVRNTSNMAPSSASPSVKSGKPSQPGPASAERGLSIEQSVRKFRIFEALRNGDTAFISKAIRDTTEGGSRLSTSSLSEASQTGPLEDTTILHLAVQCAEQPVVEYVLSEGGDSININARDKDGNTPLHIAAMQGRGHIVRLLLLQKGVNDSIANYHGRTPLDLSRNPDIFQQLQLSRSLFVDSKIKQIQGLITKGDYSALGAVLEDSRLKTVLDINGGEFVSDIATMQSGGTLLHEAARHHNSELIQMLLLHGADPFRRDRRGKLPQDVTKDEKTRTILKKSPAAVAAQRGIQEKAVLGNASSQGAMSTTPGDALAGKESRQMAGYLKKWTNYRKGYQLRWFVLEDGVLSYYKQQDDAGSACRGAINMRIAKLNMDPTEKTKFEIIGKSSVKYSLKANHEVEAKRWFWALNNSIQWSKDQAKEEERAKAKTAELMRTAKADQQVGRSNELTIDTTEVRRNSTHSNRLAPQSGKAAKVAFDGSAAGSIGDENEGTAYGSYEPSYMGDLKPRPTHIHNADGDEDEEDYGDDNSSQAVPASKDAFEITAQSAKLQLEMMAAVHGALSAEGSRNPNMSISEPAVAQAVATYDQSIRSLKSLLGDLVKISKDRDSYWQQRLDREVDMRRMWEESMAQVAREQEDLQARVGESEQKRKRTKKALREMITSSSRPDSRADGDLQSAVESIETAPDGTAVRRPSTATSLLRRRSTLAEVVDLSDTDVEDDDEFFDAVDAGEVPVATMPPISPVLRTKSPEQKSFPLDTEKSVSIPSADGNGLVDISTAYHGYEDGIRKRLKMDADDRPKISLWGILKSMIGKDMTKMTLPVSFNEPTSLLQRCAEDMEYADLLDIAAGRDDAAERMVYVAAFAASEYASTIGRVAKPFNPLLGETYEYARPDKQYRFFIEQVSHHPPIGAAWAESPRWTYWGESAVRSKFYGKSFDINPLGTWFLRLRPEAGAPEELYTWKKVTTSVIGIITGNPTVDNYGTMEVKNWTTGETATVDFKQRGWTASSAYQISGRVADSRGNTRFSMGGHWNSKIYARLTPGAAVGDTLALPKAGTAHHRGSISAPDQVFVVWEANARPAGIPFNLTPFGVTLNDLPDNLRPWLPLTDARLRPDQRAMEDGQYDLAASEKNRVEEKQRKARREREERGEEWKPRWFVKDKDAVTGEEFWRFDGSYWRERENKNWKGVADIF